MSLARDRAVRLPLAFLAASCGAESAAPHPVCSSGDVETIPRHEHCATPDDDDCNDVAIESSAGCAGVPAIANDLVRWPAEGAP